MPSRLTPDKASMPSDHEMLSTISIQSTRNDVTIVDGSISGGADANEKTLKTIDEIYSPVFKLMKCFGIYSEQTSLKHLPHASARRGKLIQRIYCVVVHSGFWLNFIMSFADLFLGNNIDLFFMLSLWCLLIALSATTCWIVLCMPLEDSRKSRFENFFRSLPAINSNENLEKVQIKAKRGIVMCCFLFVCGAIGALVSYLVLDISIAAVEPWNRWFGFRILSLIFIIYGMGVWFLPILLFYITCLILEAFFHDLHKRMSSCHSVLVDIGTFKMEHYRLCEVVKIADKMLAPVLFGLVSLYIPLICFNCYRAINLPEEDKVVTLISNIFWLLTSSGVLAVIMIFGSKVCEKVRNIAFYLIILSLLFFFPFYSRFIFFSAFKYSSSIIIVLHISP